MSLDREMMIDMEMDERKINERTLDDWTDAMTERAIQKAIADKNAEKMIERELEALDSVIDFLFTRTSRC